MTMPFTVVLATRNQGKVRELAPLFASVHAVVRTLDDVGLVETGQEEALEVHATFEENALAKARWFFARLAGGDAPFATARMMVVADDSGLEVDALRGAPGVHSKRWSGRSDVHGGALEEANNVFLLQRLADAQAAGAPSRTARYICAAAGVWSAGEIAVRGSTEGTILAVPHGTHGFGYDPYFWSTDLGMTFGEASREAKADVSHRGRAFRVLLEHLVLREVLASG